MADKDYKAFIVEGEAREPLIIDNISKVFFTHANFKIITLPAGQNIYMLWKKLKEDDFDTDIIEVLREEHEELKEQLEGINRDDFSEVYLFFDYDGHQNNLSEDDDSDVLEQMLESFDNETENGKLYISYPMVEALRDFEEGKCGRKGQCFVPITKIGDYKFVSAERSFHPGFKDYDITVWKSIIEVFAMRISCLMEGDSTITYEQYTEAVSPFSIYKMEENEIQEQIVFVLSAFPEFLLDYFGVKLWRTCVKHEAEYTDYRKYFTYDMEITSHQGGEEITADLSKKQGSASNGEKQTPYFIILAASLLQCYPRRNCCTRLAFIDEAFSALSRERIEQMVKYLEENDFQVIYAAPPEKISSIGQFIQSTVSLVTTGRYTNAVEGLVRMNEIYS